MPMIWHVVLAKLNFKVCRFFDNLQDSMRQHLLLEVFVQFAKEYYMKRLISSNEVIREGQPMQKFS